MSSWMAAKTEMRSFARRMGVIGIIHRIQRLLGSDRRYEVKFGHALRAAVRDGDTVWDVGANLGLYTEMFSDWVGPEGRVVAFEPVPSCFSALREKTKTRSNVRLLNLGLSDTQARIPMHLADDPQGATHSFATQRSAMAPVVELPVYPGDALRAAERLPSPNVLKIDVEGFEPEVLRGLDGTLREPTCRTVLCEVHFAVLETRGQRHAPDAIQRYLNDLGFSTRWIDSSHLGAYRNGA